MNFPMFVVRGYSCSPTHGQSLNYFHVLIHSVGITYCPGGRQVGEALLWDGWLFGCFPIDQDICSVIWDKEKDVSHQKRELLH